MNPSIALETRETAGPSRMSRFARNIRALFWCVAIVFAIFQTWNSRFTMNADGISYLDLADGYLQHGWRVLVNGHWSPMYPWLIGISKSLVRPSAYAEFTLVHILNFFCLIAALAAFECMLRELIRFRRAEPDFNAESSLPEWSLQVIGYLVFLTLSLTLITTERVSPDMLMSVFAYFAVAIILRISSGGGHWGWFALLGVVLGLGYYAKAPMLPLAFIFLGAALFSMRNLRRAIPRILVALMTFVLLSLPFVLALSRTTGHLTFGESGRLNYLIVENGLGPLWYMQDVGTAHGKFVHPPQKLFEFPPVYSFSGPVGGTVPAWYDPAYWSAGPKAHFVLHRQLGVILMNLATCFGLLFTTEASLLALLLVLFIAGRPLPSLAASGRLWPIWVAMLAAVSMYLPVLVQERYIAVFLIVLWTVLFASIRLESAAGTGKLVLAGTCALGLCLGVPLTISAASDLRLSLHRHHSQWKVAQELGNMGVHSGDLVARIGGTHRVEWARLLRVRVIAEVPQEQAEYFWSSSPSIQEQVLEKFRQTGATAVVAQQMDPWAVFVAPVGWKQLGNSEFYAYSLSH